MNFRTTYVLLGVVVVALAALGIYVLRSPDKKTSPAVEGYVLREFRAADVKPEAVGTVEIERPGQTPDRMVFTRGARGWEMTAPAGAGRTDSEAVDRIVSGLLNAKTEKAADLSANPAAHGLDNPPVKVTLRAGNLSETVSLGNVTIGGSQAVVYVITSDRPDRPQAARKSDFAALFKPDPPKAATNAGQMVKGPADFRPTKVIGEGLTDAANQLTSVTVRTGKDELSLTRDVGQGWRFRVPAGFGDANSEPDFGGPKEGAGINSVTSLLNTIISIQPAGRQAVTENADLARYGLDPKQGPPLLQVDFGQPGGGETMFVGGPVKAEDGADKYYARNEKDAAVAEVPAEPVKKVLAVLANKNALRDRTVVRLTAGRVDAIDVETGGDRFELRRVGPGWQVFDADGKGRPASRKAVDDLLNRLTARQLATGFPPAEVPEDRRGFAKPAAEVRLWENGIVREEKADPNAKPKVTAPPTARVLFGVADVGDVVYARRITGDKQTDFFVPTDAFKLASRGRLEYIEASLKPLSADAVLKLAFTHGKEQFEVERADDGKPAAQTSWKINGPESLKGRSADPHKVAALLTQLSILRPTRVVSDKVTPDVLNRLEVNPESPRMRVTATVKGEGDRVYLFGGDVGAEKKSVYLKPGDQELVFEVDRGAFDLFQKADVQDTVVHRLDKAKVKAVKITGWQEVLGSPATLEIERKDGKWGLKSGGMFELDPAKVDALLDDLTAPRADAFVVYKTGPKPEHNLDVAKNALAIELTPEAGDPVKVMISPPNKEGKVFGTSSLSPGDVFVMADRFAALRAKPAALKKD